MFGSSCSNAARVVRYINGNEMTVAAITVAGHVNTSVTSNCNRNCPIGDRLPKVSNKKKPATVGGNTSGNIITASTNVLPRLRLHTKRAKNIPAKKVISVAAAAVFSVINSGSMSSPEQKNVVGRHAQIDFVADIHATAFVDAPN